jgi:3-isopropylmalate/(R)-2-methylmalate dehydratase small subunit
MKIKGHVFKFGDNVNTDEIIPARYLSTSEPHILARYCMEDLRTGFGQREDLKGSLFVAGENFGCGSSREHAPIAIKASGIRCVVACSFARIFLRNAINIGLPLVELPQAHEIAENHQLEIDFQEGKVYDFTSGKDYHMQPYPLFMQELIDCGGWLNYAQKNLMEGGPS